MNEIDVLMDLDPERLTDQHLSKIIEWHRKSRQNFVAGVKPKKGAQEGNKIDLVKLGLIKPPEPFKRRF